MSCFLFCWGDEEPLDFGVPSDRALRKPWRRMTGATAWSILNSAPDYGAGDGVDSEQALVDSAAAARPRVAFQGAEDDSLH
jgi:hypothetical protein